MMKGGAAILHSSRENSVTRIGNGVLGYFAWTDVDFGTFSCSAFDQVLEVHRYMGQVHENVQGVDAE